MVTQRRLRYWLGLPGLLLLTTAILAASALPNRRAHFRESGTTLLLDNSFSGTVAAAGSVNRQLRTAYSGSAFRVRRDNDDAEQDIGFSGGLTDTASLLSFTGSNNGYVVTVYDETGNGNDWFQSTAASQPQIVASGSLVSDSDGNVTMLFDGTDDYLTQTGFSLALPVSTFMVIDPVTWTSGDGFMSATASYQLLVAQGTGGGSPSVRAYSDSWGAQIDVPLNTVSLFFTSWESGVAITLQRDADTAGTHTTTGIADPGSVIIGTQQGNKSNIKVGEVVILSGVASGDITTIKTDLNTFYVIY